MPNHGHTGVLYRTNEYVLVTTNSNTELPTVVRIVGLFAIHDTEYNIVIKGEVHPYLMADDDKPDTHLYSDSYMVTPSSQITTFPAANVLRKVILCPRTPEDCSAFIVVDHLRPHIPLSADRVHVPYYPEKGEMVNIKGSCDETWLGHIQSVDYRAKTCKIYFYVESDNSGVYVREVTHARAMDTVLWGCILHAAHGRWEGREWHSN